MRRNLNLRYQPVTPSSVKNETKNIFYLAPLELLDDILK